MVGAAGNAAHSDKAETEKGSVPHELPQVGIFYP
jgi:hypothetical protein